VSEAEPTERDAPEDAEAATAGGASKAPAPPLAGLRVLELACGVAGPYAGRLLCMLGADVMKVEPDAGDPARVLRVDDRPLPDVSPVFVHLNAGKRNVGAGSLVLEEALAWADVVLVDAVKSQLAGTVLDPEGLAARAGRGAGPRVLATVTAFGFDAASPGAPSDELLVQAACGLLPSVGEPGREPLRLPGWQSQYMAGAYAASLVLGCLGRYSQATPGMTHVDVDWGSAMLSGVELDLSVVLHRGRRLPRDGERAPRDGERARRAGLGAGAYPAGAFPCADGYVIPGTVRPIDWELQCAVYGRPDLVDDSRFSWRHRLENREALRAEIEPWYRARTKHEIFEAALEKGWAAAMVMTAEDTLSDVHLAARGFLAECELDGADLDESGTRVHAVRRVHVAGRPWLGAAQPGGALRLAARAADTGVHEREDLRGAAPPSATSGAHPAPATASVRCSMPLLSGVRVLELTWAWAGPFIGRMLGALGAATVRIEAGGWPDGWRGRMRMRDIGAPLPEGADPEAMTWDASPLYNGLNRSKRGISVDLAHPSGREVFLRMLPGIDVLVLNMTHHVLAQRGIEAAVMAAVDTGLVVVNMPFLGASGPYRGMPGYGTLAEGMGGLAARHGYTDEGARCSTTYYPDAVAGIHGTLAALSGLAQRQATGRGSYLDVSQQEVTWLHAGEAIPHRALAGREPERMGNAEPGCAPSGVYPTRDGRFLAVVIARDDAWRALVKLASPLLDAHAAWTASERVAARSTLDALLAEYTRTFAAESLASRLASVGIAATCVRSFREVFDDGTLDARHWIESLHHPLTGPRWYLRVPGRVDGRPLDSTRPAPCFAEHTDEILATWAGLTPKHIAALRDEGAVGTVPRQPARGRS
jgi:crotonobetainyl-CoA:carnitine CoA-transferase CaiB-like acyl-CoA transferase